MICVKLLEQEAMFGKKQIIILLALSMLFSGCNDTPSEDGKTLIKEEKISLNELREKNFTIEISEVNILNNIEMDNSDELFKESSLYDLPSDIYFSPHYLSDEGDLFGTAYEYDNSKINYLMKYNVNLSEKKKIEGTEYTVGYEAVKALAVSNQHLIYEKYSNGTLNYILYDMNTDESKTIIQLNSVPTMYTSQVTIHDDLALFSLFNAETGLYQLKSYSFSTNEVK